MKLRYTTDEFINKARLAHGDKYDYSQVKYINVVKKVIIVCPEHGPFKQSPRNHLDKKGCPYCGRNRTNESMTRTQEEFISLAKSAHGDRYDYSQVKYVSTDENVTIICRKHGPFKQLAGRHLSASVGCRKCFTEERRLTTEDFIKKATKVHKGRYDYSLADVVLSTEKVKIICPDHGVFEQTPNAHAITKAGCPVCNFSRGELVIGEVLDKMGIEYEAQKRFPPNRRFYDFFLPTQNVVIEFHGMQHYIVAKTKFFGGELALKKRQQRDLEKELFARALGYSVLVISYPYLKKITKRSLGEWISKAKAEGILHLHPPK